MKVNPIVVNDMALWCDSFLNEKVEEMTAEMCGLLFRAYRAEHTQPTEEIAKIFLYQVIDKRSEYLKLPLSTGLKAFLTYLSRTPGAAVMYLSLLKFRQSVTKQTSIVGLEDLTSYFPNGFPTKASIDRLWDLQKIKGGNMLDIAFIPE